MRWEATRSPRRPGAWQTRRPRVSRGWGQPRAVATAAGRGLPEFYSGLPYFMNIRLFTLPAPMFYRSALDVMGPIAALDRIGIDHPFVPRRTTARRFNGANFPENFIDGIATLVERGRLKVLWACADLVLVGSAE